MKLFLRSGALLIIALSALSAATPAGYNPSIVAADARWVVYANFDALRASTLGKELVAAVEKAQAQTTQGVIGIDVHKVLTTVGSITAYGTNFSPDPKVVDGALIAQGTADLRKIAESLLLQGTLAHPEAFTEEKDLPFPAYAISDPKDKSNPKISVIVAFPPEPIVLVSKSRAQLLKARDVFRGSAPSLAKSGSPALTRYTAQTAGAYLFAASVVPTETPFPQNGPQARFLQLASSGAIAFGELDADTFAHAELLATSENNAEKLMKILQGMTSMLSLAESNDKQLGEFLNATAVTREKETVTLHLAYPSKRLLQMTENLRNQLEARTVSRPPTITHGKVVAEWQASATTDPSAPGELTWRTVENVRLMNGATLTLGRWQNGGKNVRFDRLEVIPVDAAGTTLTFRSDLMRNVRGTMSQIQFPGADGNYTLKVAYINDPEGKAKLAVSIRNPDDPPAAPSSSGTVIRQQKAK
jgi:hypothetical protein